MNLNYTNGTVFYRRAILEDVELRSAGFFYQAELLARLIRKGYMYAEVPNILKLRKGGATKAIKMKALVKVIGDYLNMMYAFHVSGRKTAGEYKDLNRNSITHKKYAQDSE